MNPFYLGQLSALAASLRIEAEFLTNDDEDSHTRLAKLVEALEKVMSDLVRSVDSRDVISP